MLSVLLPGIKIMERRKIPAINSKALANRPSGGNNSPLNNERHDFRRPRLSENNVNLTLTKNP